MSLEKGDYRSQLQQGPSAMVELCPPQEDVLKSKSPIAPNIILCGNRAVAGVMSSDEVILELEWAPILYDWRPYKKNTNGRGLHKKSHCPVKMKAVPGEASTNRRTPKIGSKPPGAREEARNSISLTPSERTNTVNTLITLLASRTVGEHVSHV